MPKHHKLQHVGTPNPRIRISAARTNKGCARLGLEYEQIFGEKERGARIMPLCKRQFWRIPAAKEHRIY